MSLCPAGTTLFLHESLPQRRSRQAGAVARLQVRRGEPLPHPVPRLVALPQSPSENGPPGASADTAADALICPPATEPLDVEAPASGSLDAALEELVRGVASGSGLSVVGIRLLSHRIPLTVQVLVQRADGVDVNLDECAQISAPLGEALEASGLLGLAYVLEVSSPGIGEVLASDRDFTSFRGFPVEVVRHDADDTPRRQGLLLGRDERMVLLNVRGRTVRIPREEVSLVRLICPTDDS